MATRKPTKRKAAEKASKVPAISQIEAAFCHLLIQGKTITAAAEELGLAPADGARYNQRKGVQQYMSHYRAIFAEKVAEYEAAALFKRKITRESIAEHFMALATMPPERTKGSIDGQVEALKAVGDLLGLKFDPKALPGLIGTMTDEQLRAYEAGKPQ